MTDLERNLLTQAIERLDDELSRAGCNDLVVPNIPEMESIWHEYERWNLNGGDDYDHEFFQRAAVTNKGDAVVHDGVLIYLLRKHTGLIAAKDGG